MGAKSKGTAREHKVADLLVAHAFVVYRSAGSHGCGDLVAMRRDGPPMLVQVKATAGGPWTHFRPSERTALYAEARQAGAVAVLAWWPPRKPLRWYAGPDWTEVDWDGVRERAA
jgi:Holliday junction resolvase